MSLDFPSIFRKAISVGFKVGKISIGSNWGIRLSHILPKQAFVKSYSKMAAAKGIIWDWESYPHNQWILSFWRFRKVVSQLGSLQPVIFLQNEFTRTTSKLYLSAHFSAGAAVDPSTAVVHTPRKKGSVGSNLAKCSFFLSLVSR